MRAEIQEEAQGGNRIFRKADGIISVMTQFCFLLKKENAALEKYKVKDMEKLVAAKDKIVNIYAEQYQFFSSNPDALNSLDEVRKKEIGTISKVLQDLMKKNEELLKVNIDTSRRIVNMIIEGAKKQENEDMGVYSSRGSLGYEKASKNSLSYNEVL